MHNLLKMYTLCVLLTSSHNPLHPCLLNAALHITQVLNISIGKHWNVHRFPAVDAHQSSTEKTILNPWEINMQCYSGLDLVRIQSHPPDSETALRQWQHIQPKLISHFKLINILRAYNQWQERINKNQELPLSPFEVVDKSVIKYMWPGMQVLISLQMEYCNNE